MKITRIIYDWPQPWAGLSPAPYEMTKAQVRLGHSFNIFCGFWPSSGGAEELEGVKLHKFIREPISGTLCLTTSVLAFIKYFFWKDHGNTDIVHSHGHLGIWIYFYRKLLKKYFPKASELDTPFVTHFHNTFEGRKEKMESKGQSSKPISKYISWPLGAKSDQWAVEVSDAMIFVSNELKEEAIKYYNADPNKCFVIESGVNDKLFCPTKIEEIHKSRKDIGFEYDDKVILNLGMQVERKNIHLLIEALPFLPPYYKLLLVGSGDDEYGLKLEELIHKLGLRERVKRAQYTPYPQAHIAYQMSDIFVLPSSFEGLPKAVLEALSCGIPALVSGFKASKEIRGLSYLQNLEPKNIADNILNITSQPKNVDRTAVILNYSWDVKAREVDEVYRHIVK